MSYFFSMLRFVPDAARGEFINLGAVVGDDQQQDWELRLISNFTRARAIDAKGFLPIALTFAGELEERLPTEDAEADLDRDRLTRMALEMNNVVQLSMPTPIVADDASSALDTIFEELVLDPASRQYRFKKKTQAVKSMRDAYKLHAIPADAVKERVRVEVDRFGGGFDFAVHNGAAVQLVGCWSFQLPNQAELAEQVKAWAWVCREMMDHGGGTVIAGGSRMATAADVEIAAVYVPPRDGEDAAAYDESMAAFSDAQVVPIASADVGELAQRAAGALAAAH